jgi:hypothetical protein
MGSTFAINEIHVIWAIHAICKLDSQPLISNEWMHI